MWRKNRKSKTMVLNTVFTKLGGGRLNGDGDRRGISYGGGWENFSIFDNITLYLGNGTRQPHHRWLVIIRNDTWSDDSDIANDLQWPLTTPYDGRSSGWELTC